ncbi:MAG: aminomethyl-transferring glycine dehydrogenase subunit GcvPA [Candidatus Delongbacteria bacterium]|nr:aminomethyl-transferring glycine dehydrogenase subunit GcvPA [Candidatus Delongbacteria bacterium]
MPYISNTEKDRQEMLKAIGVSEFKDLLKEIPDEFIFKGRLGLGKGLSELEVSRQVSNLAKMNRSTSDCVSYLGAGSYDHYIPSIVPYLISRPEFQTAYTPYQAEVSQGTLQSIYEYQSLICNLTGMDICNASMYDGASAMAEAAILACRHTRKNTILISSTVNPGWIEVVRTFTKPSGYEIEIVEVSDGTFGKKDLEKKDLSDASCIMVQNPNFFGIIEDHDGIADIIHGNKGLLVTAIDPISIGLLKKPSESGSDIVVAEGQALGLPQAFGGPYLGIFAATKPFMRKIPGRVVGVTEDVDGKRGFVLTLQTREQHIRRDKATSNICSNQALCALAAGIYLNTMGEQGLKEVAENCYRRSHYLAAGIITVDGFELKYKMPFFKEFVVKTKYDVEKVMSVMLENGIFAGISLKRFGMASDEFLVAVTEKRSREEMDDYISVLKKFKDKF